MRATCFVITDYAGRLNRWDVAYGGRRFAHLAWRDMRAWQGRGIEFASHTATHPRLTRGSSEQVRGELARSRLAIREELGVDATAVSYPFGAFGEREERLAREVGYGRGSGLRVERGRNGDRESAGVSVGANDAGRGGAAGTGARGGGDRESMRGWDDAHSWPLTSPSARMAELLVPLHRPPLLRKIEQIPTTAPASPRASDPDPAPSAQRTSPSSRNARISPPFPMKYVEHRALTPSAVSP